MTYINEQLKTEIKYECDVLVAGGGVAGISAALAAARSGAKVILCEREYSLGGLATLGLITIYLPLCDGRGTQASFGIAEELLKLSIKYGAQDRYPKPWLEDGSFEEKSNTRYEVQFNPQIFLTLAEQLLVTEGVQLLYGTHVCAVNINDKSISSAIIESKSGRGAIKLKTVVDATGDADVAFMCGEKTALNPRLNPLAAWYYEMKDGALKLVMHGAADIPEENKTHMLSRQPLIAKKYNGIGADELTEMMILSRKSSLTHMLKTSSAPEPVTLPTIPQVRMTRRICGKYELMPNDNDKFFADSIGMIGNWYARGPIIEIPYSALLGSKVKNLITAGRCISSVGDMWNVTRVIPACAVTGQAAGTAASMCNDFGTIDVSLLQKKLVSDGVVLHISDIK